MAKDYKYRANHSKSKNKSQQASVAWWKWLLILVLIALFVVFLVFLSNSTPEINDKKKTETVAIAKKSNKAKITTRPKKVKPKEPRFDFYTVLPETEVVVPDYEINTRSREEQFGKEKATQYIMQAGAFKDFSEADKLRARLALLGIESKVEQAKVGKVVWNRVRMGPFKRSSQVLSVKNQLKNNSIDVIVTEIKK